VVRAIFDLTDNGQSLGSISIPFQLGRLTRPLAQDFEGVTVPALPQGWLARNTAGGRTWTTTSNAPPNALLAGEPGEVNDQPPQTTGPVSISAFCPDPSIISDSALYSPRISIMTAQAQLSFRHSFDLQRSFDGGVLEIAIGAQPFTDILQAGGLFVANGYNLTLAAGTGEPLAGRAAWSGDSGGWLITKAVLPPGAAQQSVQLRWRLGTDASTAGNGWYIDDVAVSEYPCAPPVTNPVMLRPGFTIGAARTFSFFIDTVPTRLYDVEFKDDLNRPNWQPLTTLTGDGTEQHVTDATLGPSQRFYRFRVE